MYGFINNFIHDLSQRKRLMYDDIFYFAKTANHYVARRTIDELAAHVAEKYADESIESLCMINALTMNIIVPTMAEMALLLHYGVCSLDMIVYVSEFNGIHLRDIKYYTETPDPLDYKPLRPGIMTASPRGMYIAPKEISLLASALENISDKEIENDILSHLTFKEDNKMDKNSEFINELINEFEDSSNTRNTSAESKTAVLFPKTEQQNTDSAEGTAGNMPPNNIPEQYNQAAGIPNQYNQNAMGAGMPDQYNQSVTGMPDQYSSNPYGMPNQYDQYNSYNQYNQYNNGNMSNQYGQYSTPNNMGMYQQSQYNNMQYNNMQYSNQQSQYNNGYNQYNVQYPNQPQQSYNQGNMQMSMPAAAFQQSQYVNQQPQYVNQQSQYVNAQSIYSQSTMEDNGDIYEMRKNKVLGVLDDNDYEAPEEKKKSKGGFMGLFGKK